MMRFLILLVLTFLPNYCFAQQWHQVDTHTFIIAPNKTASQLQANQAIVTGTTCAAIINSHGDFTVLEQTINQIKKRLSVPVCYLISTGSSHEEVLGSALLQHAFPAAKWVAPNYVKDNIQIYQDAYVNKIKDYSRSYSVSAQRIKNLSNEEQAHWQKKLHAAQQRIKYWQSLSLPFPQNMLTSLQLGKNILDITPAVGASAGDLLIFNRRNGGLFGGASLDPIPYVTHQHLPQWYNTLLQLKRRNDVTWLLPSHGKPYKLRELNKPISFLHVVMSLNNKPSPTVPASLRILYKKDVAEQQKLQLLFNLALKHMQSISEDVISAYIHDDRDTLAKHE
ncbi:hypothetical protein PCIT_a3219 [Pseudoalteromonas citrea]|uniref:MBL fold metallo-hydrolase n=2 Tax=Pseudoalteromonas citrea TaxID=43655 RepID=A0AAD4AGU7_9GAMM|nr:hypothetical protein [Pseudoalteromonas citrea]KAF7768732.1 hypothetical protein PCIT_a3219 [Pseudoalteromonas citrea]